MFIYLPLFINNLHSRQQVVSVLTVSDKHRVNNYSPRWGRCNVGLTQAHPNNTYYCSAIVNTYYTNSLCYYVLIIMLEVWWYKELSRLLYLHVHLCVVYYLYMCTADLCGVLPVHVHHTTYNCTTVHGH